MKLLITASFVLSGCLVYSQFPLFIIGLLGHEPLKVQNEIAEDLSQKLDGRTLYYPEEFDTKKLQKWYPNELKTIPEPGVPDDAVYLTRTSRISTFSTQEYDQRGGCPDDPDNYSTEYHQRIVHTYYLVKRDGPNSDTIWRSDRGLLYKTLPKALYYQEHRAPLNTIMLGASMAGTERLAPEISYERRLTSRMHLLSSVYYLKGEDFSNTSFKIGGRYKQYRRWSHHTLGWLIGGQFQLTNSNYVDIYNPTSIADRGREREWIAGWSGEFGHYLNIGKQFYLEGVTALNVYYFADPDKSGHKVIGSGQGLGGILNYGMSLKIGYRF